MSEPKTIDLSRSDYQHSGERLRTVVFMRPRMRVANALGGIAWIALGVFFLPVAFSVPWFFLVCAGCVTAGAVLLRKAQRGFFNEQERRK
jgi:hypothetical protein